jgi:hypothetical protein
MVTELAMTTSPKEIVPYSTPRRRGDDDDSSDDFVSFIVAVFVVVGPHILIFAEINNETKWAEINKIKKKQDVQRVAYSRLNRNDTENKYEVSDGEASSTFPTCS